MRPFDWNLIQSFLAVLETGSLSSASRKLGNSQPTLGRHVTTLEEQLGATLFTRTGRELIPTQTAFDLASQANAMRNAASKISLSAAGHSEKLEGTVRVTASEVMATYALPPIIARLLEEEDGLEIELVASNSTENLLRREADIAIRMHRPEQVDLTARKIGDIPIGLFASDSYLKKYGVPHEVVDLSQHLFLGYDTSDLMIQGIRAFGIEMSRHDFRFRTDNQITYLEAIASGMGIGATAELTLENRQGVTQILKDFQIPPMPMWIAAHQELKTSAIVRRVFDGLANGLKEVCAQQTNKPR